MTRKSDELPAADKAARATFDPDALREKCREERDKRLQSDANVQ